MVYEKDAIIRAIEEKGSELEKDERDVIRLRYGVGVDSPYSLVETAKELGMPITKVRALETSALRILVENN